MHNRAGIREAQMNVLAGGMIFEARHQAQSAAVHKLNSLKIDDDWIACISGVLQDS